MADFDYKMRIHRLDVTLADVRLDFPDLPADVEVRGRLMGPRCPGVTTIEISYALRPVGKAPVREYQVLIPEPSFWEAARPYVYEGPLEFWRGGEQLGKTWASVGLRQK